MCVYIYVYAKNVLLKFILCIYIYIYIYYVLIFIELYFSNFRPLTCFSVMISEAV